MAEASFSYLKKLVQDVATSVGLPFELSSQQIESICQFARGKDVFVSLPTGFGKTMCYTLLPRVFDRLRGVEKKSIAIVISPLIALMEEQVLSVQSLGISAVYVSDVKSRDKHQIKAGMFQVIFMSPEALFCSTVWKHMLSTELYRTNLVAMVVDEAHCVKKWGDAFRKEFSHLSEVRSIIPDTVHVMALTATATLATRKFIIDNLCMEKPFIVYVPPAKDNITYYVGDKPKGGIVAAFQPICKAILENKNIGRILIFCRSYADVISIHHTFKITLGEHILEPPGSPDYVNYRVVDMFTHCTHSTVKKKIIQQFTTDSPLQVVIATIAFGMGMNCPDIRQIIHWGLPQDAEAYVQESGRAGRDKKQSIAIILKRPHDFDKRYSSEQMIEYCRNTSVCRRSILYRDFQSCGSSLAGCLCCDVCAKSCNCGHCQSNITSFIFPVMQSD